MEVDGRAFLDVAMLVGPTTVFHFFIAMLLNTNVPASRSTARHSIGRDSAGRGGQPDLGQAPKSQPWPGQRYSGADRH